MRLKSSVQIRPNDEGCTVFLAEEHLSPIFLAAVKRLVPCRRTQQLVVDLPVLPKTEWDENQFLLHLSQECVNCILAEYLTESSKPRSEPTCNANPVPPYSKYSEGCSLEKTRASTTLLSTAITQYFDERKESGKWTDRTKEQVKKKIQTITEAIGDRLCSDVTADDVSRLKEYVRHIPSNRNKRPEYRDKTKSELAQMEIPEEDRMDSKTVAGYLSQAKRFFEWGRDEGLFGDFLSRLKFESEKTDWDEEDGRSSYSDADLQRFFQSEEFVEQRGGRYWKDFMFFVPLIALYSGMRQNEMCQLHLDDIYQTNGIWVFDINRKTPDKRLKNKYSKRIVPIHPKLIQLGLLHYHKTMLKEGHDRLFPQLKLKKDGYGSAVSKCFLRTVKRLDIDHVFHDFRHTAVTKLQQSGIHEEEVAALVGHKHKNVTFGKYGDGFLLPQLKKWVEYLEYDVDLTHLRDPMKNLYLPKPCEKNRYFQEKMAA